MARIVTDRSSGLPESEGSGVPMTDREFQSIRDLVYSACRINLSTEKKELVRNRLGKRMRALGVRSFQDYYDRVVNDPSGGEMSHLLNAITTNLTSFFRENQHFDFIQDVFIPEFLKRPQAERETLRVWSAACSTGEEPYSLVISLLEDLPGERV